MCRNTSRSPITAPMTTLSMLNWLRQPKMRGTLGYALAVVSMVVAVLAARTLLDLHVPLAITAFSFCAIAITFWYGGTGPGLLATVLAVVVRTFFFEPELPWILRIAYDFVFMLFSFFMLQATRAKNHLEWIVTRRTAALTRANETLQQEVAERKRAEEALQQNVKALQNALEEIQVLKDQLYKENLALREEIDVNRMFEEIVGSSPALQVVLSRVAKVAPTDSTVLVTGETGTGKELIARAIHKRSQRAARAFVSVNCSAIPSSLIASELFGHEKGAFTGAIQRRLGRFELADGGTLFLDEIGELSQETQIALLRVLQEREFERVGSNYPVKVDVRLIAATNRDLPAAVTQGTFRQDLFYRLNVFPIAVPPLRERAEDVPLLVEYFVGRFAKGSGKTIRNIGRQTLQKLRAYPWPGNIRELQNVVERAVILSESDTFEVDESWLKLEPAESARPHGGLLALADREVEMIEAALADSHGASRDLPGRRRNSAFHGRHWNRRSSGSASISTGRSTLRRNSVTFFSSCSSFVILLSLRRDRDTPFVFFQRFADGQPVAMFSYGSFIKRRTMMTHTEIHFHQRTTLTPEQYIAGLTDFGPGRAKLFGNSADEYLTVHHLGRSEADVTEGSGGIWERLHYDWSDPNHVVLTTTDSNLWGGASGHVYTFTRHPDGTTDIDLVVIRDGKNLKGRLLGIVVRTVGRSVLEKAFANSVKAIEARNVSEKELTAQ